MELHEKLGKEDISMKEKYSLLKEFVVSNLKEIVDLIEKEDYNSVYDYLSFSPGGDGYGDDHHYIEFNYLPQKSNGIDMHEMLGILLYFQKEMLLEQKRKENELFKKIKLEHPNWSNKKVRSFCKEHLML